MNRMVSRYDYRIMKGTTGCLHDEVNSAFRAGMVFICGRFDLGNIHQALGCGAVCKYVDIDVNREYS
jgi:hypothetical protein